MMSPPSALAAAFAVLGLVCGASVAPAAGSVPAPIEAPPAQAAEFPPEETLFATPTRKDRIGRVLARSRSMARRRSDSSSTPERIAPRSRRAS